MPGISYAATNVGDWRRVAMCTAIWNFLRKLSRHVDDSQSPCYFYVRECSPKSAFPSLRT